MKTMVVVLALFLVMISAEAQKKRPSKISEAQASKIALEHVRGGTIESAELEKESGRLIWSFDVKTDNGIHEVWVDAVTGKYIKTEKESAAQEKDEALADKAEKAALGKVPGEIVKQEIESKNGKQIYSFDIKTKSGKMFDVEVDAKTSKILSAEEEKADQDDGDDDDDD